MSAEFATRDVDETLDTMVDDAYVNRMLADVVRNEDLSRYIL